MYTIDKGYVKEQISKRPFLFAAAVLMAVAVFGSAASAMSHPTSEDKNCFGKVVSMVDKKNRGLKGAYNMYVPSGDPSFQEVMEDVKEYCGTGNRDGGSDMGA